jgi:hypothetical protein
MPELIESCGPIPQKLEASFEKYGLSPLEVNRTIAGPPFCKHLPGVDTSPSGQKPTRVDYRSHQSTLTGVQAALMARIVSGPDLARDDEYGARFGHRPPTPPVLYSDAPARRLVEEG